MWPKNRSAPLCREGQPRKSHGLADPLRRSQATANQSHPLRLLALSPEADSPDADYIRRVQPQRGSEIADVFSASILSCVLPESPVSGEPKGPVSFSLRAKIRGEGGDQFASRPNPARRGSLEPGRFRRGRRRSRRGRRASRGQIRRLRLRQRMDRRVTIPDLEGRAETGENSERIIPQIQAGASVSVHPHRRRSPGRPFRADCHADRDSIECTRLTQHSSFCTEAKASRAVRGQILAAQSHFAGTTSTVPASWPPPVPLLSESTYDGRS